MPRLAAILAAFLNVCPAWAADDALSIEANTSSESVQKKATCGHGLCCGKATPLGSGGIGGGS
jgi:hypothetical protein